MLEWRRGVQVVSALEFGLKIPASSTSQVIVFTDSWEGNLTLTVPHPLPPPQGFN